MSHPKWIIEDNKLIIGKVAYHKYLANDKSKVKGGGFWLKDSEKKEIYLSGKSYEFGKALFEDVKSAVFAGNVYSSKYHTHRVFEDYTFYFTDIYERKKIE